MAQTVGYYEDIVAGTHRHEEVYSEGPFVAVRSPLLRGARADWRVECKHPTRNYPVLCDYSIYQLDCITIKGNKIKVEDTVDRLNNMVNEGKIVLDRSGTYIVKDRYAP